jgi:hypothetical protein
MPYFAQSVTKTPGFLWRAELLQLLRITETSQKTKYQNIRSLIVYKT